MAKEVSVSTDDITYNILSGSTADFNYEVSSATDTVFGAAFNSEFPTLITTSYSADGFYKGVSGYCVTFNKSGTSTAAAGEAMSLVSGKTYSIDDVTKNVWDRAVTLVVYDGVTDVTVQVESIDHLFGQVTFLGAYTVLGAVTVDVNYLPMASIGTAREFSLSQTTDSIDTTDFATACANGGFMTNTPGLLSVSLDASGFFATANDFKTLVANRAELIVEICPDGNDKSIARGFFRAASTGQTGDVGGNEDESISFVLSVPDDATVVTPFKWVHASDTTLNQGIQDITTQWQAQGQIYVKYLHDGTNGWKGLTTISDCSLSNSVDGIPTFSFSFEGDSVPTAVP